VADDAGRSARASADGLSAMLLRPARYGMPLAVLVTLLTLALPEDAALWVWGAAMLVGLPALAVGLGYHVLFRQLMRLEARWVPGAPVRPPYPVLLRLEGVALALGVPLVLTWLLLSAALLARGERLF